MEKHPNPKVAYSVGAILVVILAGGVYLSTKTGSIETVVAPTTVSSKVPSQAITVTPTSLPISGTVIVKANGVNPDDSDVYIEDPTTKKDTLFQTIPNVYADHYHVGEYYNGNLYIIRRIGDTNTTTWTDQLWLYTQANPSGKLIYSVQGLDFRVSPDQHYIAFLGGDAHTTVTITTTAGVKVGDISPPLSESDASLNFEQWSGTTLWMSDGLAYGKSELDKIEVPEFKITQYPVDIASHDFALNPTTDQVAYSDVPVELDVDSGDAYLKSSQVVHLYLLDLTTNTKQVLATGVALAGFNPVWTTPTTLQYQDATGTTITKSF